MGGAVQGFTATDDGQIFVVMMVDGELVTIPLDNNSKFWTDADEFIEELEDDD